MEQTCRVGCFEPAADIQATHPGLPISKFIEESLVWVEASTQCIPGDLACIDVARGQITCHVLANASSSEFHAKMTSADRPATRLATRLGFFVAGFGIAAWAPLVPFAKQRLAVDDGVLGLLLLCLGIGSVVAMLLTGALSARYGSKPIHLAGGFRLAPG